MELAIGQKVAYPSQGICLVEDIKKKPVGNHSIMFYLLRVLGDNSTIFVPTENAETVGIRPIICLSEFKRLMNILEKDFDEISADWKSRSREYSEKLQSGDVFAAADVLKKLTFLSLEKKLSFREQNLLEKARFLIISEIVNGNFDEEERAESKISKLVQCACRKHQNNQLQVMSAMIH
ncbi:MAG TPA: CarD family transcriptional regulator [Pyrinomonadaceae bacterium]|nr:CarD family transcriptional regulator [Pyrinomonadaceae bacterium]